MIRRKECSDKERDFRNKIKKEHDLFEFEALSRARREIYDNCNKIRFYESIYEYVLYQNRLDRQFVTLGLETVNLLDALYQLYLEYEWLEVSTWDDIEEIIEKYISIRLQREDLPDKCRKGNGDESKKQ